MSDTSGIKKFLETLPEHKRQSILLQFEESVKTLHESLQKSVAENSYTGVRHAAHDLKTLARLVSENDLADLCEITETHAMNEAPAAFEGANALSPRIENLKNALYTYRGEVGY